MAGELGVLFVLLCCLSCLTHDPGNVRAQLWLTCLSAKTYTYLTCWLSAGTQAVPLKVWGTRDGTKG